MALVVFIPDRYESRYSLLDAMAAEVATAFSTAGAEVNPTRPVRHGEPTLHLFFNLPQSLDQFLKWARPERPNSALVQFFVDHPLGLTVEFMDKVTTLPNYRLAMPCTDDRTLLATRWPTLRTMICGHGIPRAALCDPATIDAPRRDELLLSGTISTEDEVRALRDRVPEVLRSACDRAATMLADNPSLSLVQSLDLTLPPTLFAGDYWRLIQVCSRHVVAAANRQRRLAMLRALQGLPVAVFGPPAWTEHCTGSIQYRGEVEYGTLAAEMARSRAVLAWNPTQFTLGHSERVLLSMAAGAATLTDDRPSVRTQLGTSVATHRSGDLTDLRAQAERLLGDPAHAAQLAHAGRREAERAHLWEHRLQMIGSVVAEVLGRSTQPGST